MTEGASVTVKDGKGALIATGSLQAGDSGAALVLGQSVTCDMPFEVTNVPDADFYQVEVSHRGAITYSKADLESKGWIVSFSLG
jgi:hypothetical protein